MGQTSRSSSAARRPSTPFTAPITTRKSRNSLAAAAAAAATPVSTRASPGRASVASQDEDNTDDTESDEEYFQPPPALSTLKRRSTPPHSASEDVDQEDAIQVRPPAPKRQRTRAPSVVQREPEVEAEEAEDEASALNANGNDVGSNLAAFATSLGRLSQLLINAGKSLDNERIGALESEIHHDWRVDEMATFVEGFLKGASAKTAGREW